MAAPPDPPGSGAALSGLAAMAYLPLALRRVYRRSGPLAAVLIALWTPET